MDDFDYPQWRREGVPFRLAALGQLLGLWSPLQTLSGALPSLAARGDLLEPDTARLYVPCLYGRCSIGFGFSEMDRPPFCLAT